MPVVTLRLSDGDTVSLDAEEQQIHIDHSYEQQLVYVELEPEEHQLYISENEPHDIPSTIIPVITDGNLTFILGGGS